MDNDSRFDKSYMKDGSLELVGDSQGRIISLGDLVSQHGIDLNHWDVLQFEPNSWETSFKIDDEIVGRTNYSAKARLVPNRAYSAVEAAIKDLLKNIVSPRKQATRRPILKGEQYLLEIDFFDIHMGMQAWAQETGEDPFDSNKCEQIVTEALEHLLRYASGFAISKILLPIGNDLLHTDSTIQGKGGTTSAGTPQDVDTRYLKMFRSAVNLMIAVIDRCLEIANVEVVIVPGNHDRERSQYVGEVLCAWYRNHEDVVINNGANLRKYVLYGSSLLGFTHGSEEKLDELPLIMASEQKQAWADAEYHIIHTGHRHKRMGATTKSVDTYKGVEVRTIPSLIPPDAWHSSKGYVGGGRSAEAHLFGKNSGPAGYFIYNLPRKAIGTKNTQLITID